MDENAELLGSMRHTYERRHINLPFASCNGLIYGVHMVMSQANRWRSTNPQALEWQRSTQLPTHADHLGGESTLALGRRRNPGDPVVSPGPIKEDVGVVPSPHVSCAIINRK